MLQAQMKAGKKESRVIPTFGVNQNFIGSKTTKEMKDHTYKSSKVAWLHGMYHKGAGFLLY